MLLRSGFANATLERRLVTLNQTLITLTESITFFASEIDKQFTFNKDLKNEPQRKAKRIELQQKNTDYYQASRQLKEAQAQRNLLQVELNQCRNEFSVTKLMYRRQTLELEIQVAA